MTRYSCLVVLFIIASFFHSTAMGTPVLVSRAPSNFGGSQPPTGGNTAPTSSSSSQSLSYSTKAKHGELKALLKENEDSWDRIMSGNLTKQEKSRLLNSIEANTKAHEKLRKELADEARARDGA